MTSIEPQVGQLDDWWDEYKATGARAARDKLLVHYMPLVRAVVGWAVGRVAYYIDEADLVSDGVFGLMDAIDKYEPDRNVRFETYAVPRIRGAIIDALRTMDWVPRSVRARARQVEKVQASLQERLGRTPTIEETAADMGVTAGEVSGTLAAGSAVLPLDAPLGGDGDDTWTCADVLADRRDGPPAVVEVERMKQVLASAISRLSDRERIVVTLDYFEGLSLAQIGVVLGVTESRVTQIHTKAIVRLRMEMSESFVP